MSAKKILIIDDEKDFCFFTKKNLEQRADFTVLVATHPDKGIGTARRESPDLILLDISMPSKDGFAVLEILKRDTKTMGIPIVIVSAVEGDDAKMRAAGLYGEGYLTKPVTAEELAVTIEGVFRRRNRSGEVRVR